LFIDKGIAVTIFGKDGAPFINLGDKSVESPLVIASGSDLTGWQYKMMIPQHLIVRNAEGVRNVILVSVGLLLLLCCALAFGFTRNIYRPVRELVAMVKSRVGDPCSKNTEDEYSWLQNGIHAMMEQEGTLILELKRQKPMLQEAWLGRLLTGEIYPKQEFEIALKLLDINMMLPLFRVCIITRQSTFRSADCNIQMEEMLRQLKMESYNGLVFHTYTATGQFVLVANYDCEASLKRFVSRLIAAIPDTLIGIGNACSSLEAVAKSNNEAVAALDYRSITTQENNVILFEDITIMKEKYYYPLDKEYCISNCLKSGNSTDAISMVNALLTENLKHSNNSQESILNFLKNVELTALKAMDELGISCLLGRNRPEQFSSKNIAEIRGYIETLYQAICETILQRNASNSSLMQNIMQYVDECITNPALSLAMVADKFNVSVSYVSRVFTERFGINFHHYINEKRIALAREQLLLKLDISSVARIVGYESDVTFRRLFKQFVGLSPSEYRDQQKNISKCINS
jgi:two-component system, response regulator YesN